jgi:hypothetical protein
MLNLVLDTQLNKYVLNDIPFAFISVIKEVSQVQCHEYIYKTPSHKQTCPYFSFTSIFIMLRYVNCVCVLG